MSDQRDQAFSKDVVVEIIDDEGNTAPLAARFEYDPADPYAVSILFHAAPTPCRWTFARDLLIDGFYSPAGEGDVLVFPCLDAAGNAVVIFGLQSPDGAAYLQIASRIVVVFIERMLAAVPRGTESSLVDLEAAVAEVFSAGVPAAVPAVAHAAVKATARVRKP